MPRKQQEAVDEAAPVVREPVCLSYVGSGHYVIGVPTTDLCGVPAEEADRLIETGLYTVKADCAPGAKADSSE